MLTDRTCAIGITADMSFRTSLAASSWREYKDKEFFMEAKTRNRRCSSFATGGFLDTREVLILLGTMATEKHHVNPEDMLLSLTRQMDFLVERGMKETALTGV